MLKGYLQPWVFGVIAGIMIVSAEAVLNFYPPAAYSFCLTCHTRDFVNTVINAVFNQNYQVAFLSRRILMITSPSVMIGAFIASQISSEYKKEGSTHPFPFFLYGFFIMIIGILIFGCPTRIILRSGYGDLYGIIAVVGMVLGIWGATHMIKVFSKMNL